MNCGILRLFEALAKATLVALASIAALSQNVAAQAQSASPSLPGEVIAILDKNSPAQARRVEAFIDLAAQRGFALRYRHQLSGLKLEMITLALAKGVSGAEAIEILEGAAPYSVVGVNHFYELAEAPVPRLFARKAIRWPGGDCPARVNIGVIDTPVRPGALGRNGEGLVSASFLRDGERPSGRDHGASVAGILSGPAGLLSRATLFAAVAVLEDENGRALARVDHLARSINWMAENEVKVVNLSLAGPRNKIFAKVVEAAARRGMILVAAVGNAGPSSPPLFPAAFEGVIAVTAVDAAGRVYAKAVQGPHVDLAAPGVDIWLHGAEKRRYASGTSFAAPYVTARLAVASAQEGITDVASARRLLAREADDLGPAGRDAIFGAGLLRGPGRCR